MTCEDAVSGAGRFGSLIAAQAAIQAESREPFAAWFFAITGHLQGSFLLLYEGLVQLGADPRRMHVLAKSYSAHPTVIDYLHRAGVHVAIDNAFDVGRSYERHMGLRAQQMLATMCTSATPNAQIMILDEGGRLVRAATSMRLPSRHRVVAVEQTTRGLDLFGAASGRALPLISVAASRPKREIEARWVAQTMLEGIRSQVQTVPTLGDAITLVGFGAVGAHLAGELAKTPGVLTIVDMELSRIALALKGGYRVLSLQEAKRHPVNLWLGCTGRTWLRASDLALLGETLLVNCASSDIEFPAGYIRRCAAPTDSDGLPVPWHRAFTMATSAGTATTLANGGFPINFRGQLDTIPPREFQLTRALMLCGAYQASTCTDVVGLVDLRSYWSDLCVAAFDGGPV